MINLEAGKVITITGSALSSGSAWFVKSGSQDLLIGDINSTPLVLGPYINDSVIRITMGVGNFTHVYNGEDDQIPTISSAPIITKSASHTLQLSDDGKLINMGSGSAQTLTVPPNSSVPFPLGTEIAMSQSGAGALTVVAGSGVSILIPAALTLVLNGQYAVAALKKTATNTWIIAGNLTGA